MIAHARFDADALSRQCGSGERDHREGANQWTQGRRAVASGSAWSWCRLHRRGRLAVDCRFCRSQRRTISSVAGKRTRVVSKTSAFRLSPRLLGCQPSSNPSGSEELAPGRGAASDPGFRIDDHAGQPAKAWTTSDGRCPPPRGAAAERPRRGGGLGRAKGWILAYFGYNATGLQLLRVVRAALDSSC